MQFAGAFDAGGRTLCKVNHRAINAAAIIDPTLCIDCNACVDECPVKAIYRDDDVPAEFAEFIERNAAYYRKASP